MQLPDLLLQIAQILLISHPTHLLIVLALAILGDQDVVLLQVGKLRHQLLIGLL